MNETIIYFDLETDSTAEDCQIIQIAAVAVDPDGNELGGYAARVQFDPEKSDQKALEINHYHPQLWEDAIPPAQAVEEFARFLDKFKWVTQVSKRSGKPYKVARLGGYNAVGFDMPRLRRMFAQQGAFLPAHPRALDVLQLADWYFQINPNEKPESTKLETVCTALGCPIPEGEAHNALIDARYTARLAQRLKERMGYVNTVKELACG